MSRNRSDLVLGKIFLKGEFSVSLDDSSYLGTAEQLGNIYICLLKYEFSNK